MKHWELPVSGRAFAQLSHPKDDVDNSEKTLEDLGVNGLKNRFGLNGLRCAYGGIGRRATLRW